MYVADEQWHLKLGSGPCLVEIMGERAFLASGDQAFEHC